MPKRRTPLQLIIIIASSVVGVLTLTIWLLYEGHLEQQRQRLVEITQSRAQLIEAIAHNGGNEPTHANRPSQESHELTLQRITEAHRNFQGFGESGEFSLGRRNNDQIEFLLSQRHTTLLSPKPVAMNARLAEPMRRALRGESGTIVAPDYRGELVLAAYQPVDHMGWGIVTKLNVAEIQAPFIKAAITAAIIAAIIIALGSLAIVRLLTPLMRQLEEDREYQRTLFNSSPMGLALCSLDGTLVDTNPAFDKIIGRDLKESSSLSYWDITPKEYAESEAHQLEQIKLHGKYGPYEKEYIHKHGHRVPVRLSGRLIKRAGTSYILSSVEDITARVRAEKRLRQAATIFDNTDEGIIISDENNLITMVNSTFSEITGYTEAEVIAQNPKLLASGQHDTRFYERLWSHLKKDGHWRGEMWNRRKDGSIFPVWQQIAVITDENNQITNYVSTFSDISTQKELEQQLAHMAHHDELTDLPNRLYLKAQLEKSLHSAKRNQHKIALLYLDLDGFKQINDHLGHEAGDQLLIHISDRLKESVREEDTIARIGGDEFIILLSRINSPEDASVVADQVIKNICRPVQLAQETLSPSVSIGISIYPNDAESVTGLQKAADHAMYKAKADGKNTYKFFTHQQ